MAKGNYNIIRRLPIIHNAIASGKYPNKNTLVKIISAEFMDKELSVSTIGNDIEFLRTEYNAPIEFDFTRNGYYYSDKNFTLNLFNPAPEPFVSSDSLLKEEFAKTFGIDVSILNLLDKFSYLGLVGQSDLEIHPEIGECGRYYIAEDWPSEDGYWLFHIFDDNLLEGEEAVAKYEFKKMIKYLYPVEE